MKLEHKLSLYSITNEINWACLWVSIARSAHSIGDIECARYAREKANTPYRHAWELLAQAHPGDEELRSLLDDLERLRLTLNQLNRLFVKPAASSERLC